MKTTSVVSAALAMGLLVACGDGATAPAASEQELVGTEGVPAASHAGGANIAGVQVGAGVARVIWHPTGAASYHVQIQTSTGGGVYNASSLAGTPITIGGAAHLYVDVSNIGDGAYIARFKSNPSGGFEGSATFTMGATNNPPLGGFNWSPQSPNEGALVSFDATATDADGDDLTYAWDFGDGGSSTSEDPSHTYTDDGAYTVQLVVSDGAEQVTLFETVVVSNVNPTATWTSPSSVAEGASFTLSLTDPHDPSAVDMAAGLKYAFDCGTGYSAVSYATAGTVSTVSCATTDDATLSVKAKIFDKDDGATEYTETVTVTNVAPAVDVVTLIPDYPIPAGTLVQASATFTDPGADTHTATIDWNDGMPSLVAPAVSPAAGSHTYTAAGIYKVTITVTDDDGGIGSASHEYVVVYDPSAGFVTGGGFINSLPGMYRPDASLSGKANFGFVSRYLKGANVPTGNTQFQFHAAGLEFKSTSYQWLVVQGGGRASYKGFGTINGAGDYGFLLSVVDKGSSGDLFRIKIWERSSAEVIYDNLAGDQDEKAEPTTTLGGGSIVVHTGK